MYKLRKGLRGGRTEGQKPSMAHLLTNAVHSDLFGNLKESPLSPPDSQTMDCALSPHGPRRNCKEREAHATSGTSVLVGSSAGAARFLGISLLSEQTPAKESYFQKKILFVFPTSGVLIWLIFVVFVVARLFCLFFCLLLLLLLF